MEKTQVYLSPEISRELEFLKQKYGDEKLSVTARRVLRVGLERLKVEEDAS